MTKIEQINLGVETSHLMINNGSFGYDFRGLGESLILPARCE